MKNYKFPGFCFFVLFVVLNAQSLRAQRVISYQGLIEDNGTPLTGPRSLTLNIYVTETGGTPVFQETQNVTVTNGLFDVLIGKVNNLAPLAFTNVGSNHYYLGVQVDGAAELTPRSRIADVPSAFFADTANFARNVAPGGINAVASINGKMGTVTIQGGGGTTINSSGDTLTISSSGGGGGTGIQGVQNTDGSLNVQNSSGPIATISVTNGGITSSKLAQGAVTMDKINQSGATSGQVLKWSGTSWSPAAESGLTTISVHSPELTGDGTSSNPINIAQQGATSGQVLKWNGTSWSPAKDSGLTTASVHSPVLTGNGNPASPINLAQQGATTGQVLTWNGTDWVPAANSSGSGWSLTGNSGTRYGTNFIGTADSVDLQLRAYNTQAGLIQVSVYTPGHSTANTGFGYDVLINNTTGSANTAFGVDALWSNTTGTLNTANGISALQANTSGSDNTACGSGSLLSNRTGSDNTASGDSALYSNTGNNNTAFGAAALSSNTTGNNNTALGYAANVNPGTLTNATAIGANAVVTTSNSLVLGGLSGNAVFVGIGTPAPRTNLDVVGTGGIVVPVGTTNQRPSSPAQGTIRYNTTTGHFEGYDGSAWSNLN